MANPVLTLAAAVQRGHVDSNLAGTRGGDLVLISAPYADRHGLDVGDTLRTVPNRGVQGFQGPRALFRLRLQQPHAGGAAVPLCRAVGRPRPVHPGPVSPPVSGAEAVQGAAAPATLSPAARRWHTMVACPGGVAACNLGEPPQMTGFVDPRDGMGRVAEADPFEHPMTSPRSARQRGGIKTAPKPTGCLRRLRAEHRQPDTASDRAGYHVGDRT